MKRHFELHLEVIWRSEDQNPPPPPFYPYHDFEWFLGESFVKLALQATEGQRLLIKIIFHPTHTFFDIFTFVLPCAQVPFRKFNVRILSFNVLRLSCVVIAVAWTEVVERYLLFQLVEKVKPPSPLLPTNIMHLLQYYSPSIQKHCRPPLHYQT